MTLNPGMHLGRYEIRSKLGEGGMGEVYLAQDTKLDRKVALKILPAAVAAHPDRMRRFVQEARAASALNHPNIITIHEVEQIDSVNFIATEFVDGETLRERMRSAPMRLDKALDVATQISNALSAAHTAGIIHRDIKPENVMLRRDGIVKVLDFGLAKLTQASSPSIDTKAATKPLVHTEPGRVMGTVAYMSPEQVRGLELDARTDIWSLGVVLYEMLAGRTPFSGETSSHVSVSILEREPAPLGQHAPQARGELQRIVRKALAKDHDDRYQTARDLLIDLKNLRRELELQSEIERSLVPSVETPIASTAQIAPETKTDSLSQPTGVLALRSTSSAEYLIGEIKRHGRGVVIGLVALFAVAAIVTTVAFLIFQNSQVDQAPKQRMLTRLTFDTGLQSEPTWSPDGRFVAYSADRGGNFDIWVQPVGGGNPIQVTKSPAHDWQPSWSADGNNIAFRSEREGGGLYIVPALGGSERKISSLGYHPRWSPDGSKILFDTQIASLASIPTLYLTTLDGSPPREILTDFWKDFAGLQRSYVAWHPDSRRVSVWVVRRQIGREFWTVPIDGGTPVKSEISPEVDKWLKEASVNLSRFVWSSSGHAIYFEGDSHGVTNLWKITVDQNTLRWIAGPERLTTGPGKDSDITISPDGKKLAFTARTENTRVWVLPFDAATGQVKGEGKPETPAGINAWQLELSHDSKKLVYVALRPGKRELWVKSLDDGNDKLLLAADEYFRDALVWSRDDTRLAYRRFRSDESGDSGGASIVVLPSAGGDEQVITSNGRGDGPKDWFSDGQRLLGLTTRPDGERWKIWIVPLAAAPQAENEAQVIVSDPDYNFYQPKLSPDDRWICFMKAKATELGIANLYVMRTSGGEQTQITTGKYLDDKLRWSPDGKTIYFLSQRGGFFNAWGIHFDPINGKRVGEPFRVTTFESPSHMAMPVNNASEMSVAANRLALPITEVSGSIWILENVDR